MNVKQGRGNTKSKIGMFFVVYLLLALLLYFVVKDDWSMSVVKADSVSMGYLLPAGSEISQTIKMEMDAIDSLEFVPHFDKQERAGSVSLVLLNDDTVCWTKDIAAAELPTDQQYTVHIEPALSNPGDELTLRITPNETGMALWAGNTVDAGKFDVMVQTSGLTVNGESYNGSLVLKMQGHKQLSYIAWYWPGVVVILAIIALLAMTAHLQRGKGRRTLMTVLITVCKQYRYLLMQLVWRDFRVKYKSSVLGMVWSFLNPLLTMLVYYFVFSTLFKSDVEYFQVYLMSGIVLFNYFTEATSLGLSSIIDNSSLITKVYMPKVIYPLSKVCSSAINLCISFIPLFLVVILSGVHLSKSMLLVPVVVVFLILFCLGISLLLATMYVFFRDVKFLWGVLLTMWNFLTPIFYPENIIPAEFLGIYRCNPMYQIVGFMRTIILDGVAPTPESWLFCALASIIPLLLGLWVFRHKQDYFVLYL